MEQQLSETTYLCPDHFPTDASPESRELREAMLFYHPSNPYFQEWVKINHGNHILDIIITYAWNSAQGKYSLAYKFLEFEASRQQTSGVESSQALFIRLFAEYFTQLSQHP